MDKLEKVIHALENCTAEIKCRDCPWDECEGQHEHVELPKGLALKTLELLKAQEPRVMTLEELYDAEYVFFEDNRTGVLCLLPSGDDEYESYFTSRHCDIIQRWKDNYKKSWRCWTSRPSDSERGNTPWAE